MAIQTLDLTDFLFHRLGPPCLGNFKKSINVLIYSTSNDSILIKFVDSFSQMAESSFSFSFHGAGYSQKAVQSG